MPQLRSATKRLRSDEKKRLRNQRVQSELKTLTKKLDSAIAGGDVPEAGSRLKELTTKLQKATGKGIIPARRAARHTSRAVHRVQRLTAKSSSSA